MAAGCLYDAIFALGSKFLELRGNVVQLLGQFVEIDVVSAFYLYFINFYCLMGNAVS